MSEELSLAQWRLISGALLCFHFAFALHFRHILFMALLNQSLHVAKGINK
jgi:hypothetical protein